MTTRPTENHSMLDNIAHILKTPAKKAYDADYSALKSTYRGAKIIKETEPEIIDYDLSCDADYVDNLHELY